MMCMALPSHSFKDKETEEGHGRHPLDQGHTASPYDSQAPQSAPETPIPQPTWIPREKEVQREDTQGENSLLLPLSSAPHPT